MPSNINRVIVSGNATRDPELRRTQSGMTILSFGIAVNDRRKNQQTGDWEDYANFIDVTMFGNRAESLGGIIRKGMHLVIEGKLRWSQWESNGQKRSKIEVVADEVELPPRSQQNGYQGGYQQQGGGYSQNGYGAPQAAPQQPQNGYQQPSMQQGYYAPPIQQQPQQPQQQMSMSAASGVYDEDIPF